MSFDFTTLEPHIRSILTTPDTDLETISAKRVRRQLVDYDPSLSEDFLKEHKSEVDAVIASVYESVREESAVGGGEAEPGDDADGSSAGGSQKRKYETDDEGSGGGVEDDDGGDATPAAKRKPKKIKRELSDAELARQLSSEINGSSRRNAGRSKGANGAPKKAKQRKSSAVVDSDGESDGGHEKKKRRKATGGSAKGGFAKEYTLSDALAAVLQQPKMSRPQVVKQLWVYIKSNELQNPSNRKEIMCDASLRAVFNVDKIDMFKMNKVLGQHLHEQET